MSDDNKPRVLANIWGDTVDLKHLAGAMAIGVGLGFSFFLGGVQLIGHLQPGLSKDLKNAGAMLIGIVGCLLAAVISAKLFPPKRTLSEQHFSEADRERVLKELQIDLEAEAEYMKTMSPEMLREMQELRLDSVFGKVGPGDGPAGQKRGA